MQIRHSVILILSIVAVNVLFWTASLLLYQAYLPSQLPLLVIAFTLGVRHALDADHLAAIDNVTRTLINLKPVTVGLYFSLGHSTIVILATVLVGIFSSSILSVFDSYGKVSEIIGKSIAAAFLV